jgi:nucleoside-diphosphate kinase
MERTYAMIKPDAVEGKHVGEIITRIEREGFTIVAMKKVNMSKELAGEFYGVHRERPFYLELVDYVTSGPVVAMVLEKEDAIKCWRDIMGATDPKEAEEGTLRRLYGKHIGSNVSHGSDAPETADTEIKLMFSELV